MKVVNRNKLNRKSNVYLLASAALLSVMLVGGHRVSGAGFPPPNNGVVLNQFFPPEIVAECLLPFSAVDGIVQFDPNSGKDFLYVTNQVGFSFQNIFDHIYFFDLSNPAAFTFCATNADITLTGGFFHAIIKTNSGRIFYTDKFNNLVGEINSLVPGNLASSIGLPLTPFVGIGQPDGLAYSPSLDLMTVAVNTPTGPQLWDVDPGTGVKTFLATVPGGTGEFVDHMAYDAFNSHRFLFFAGITTGNLWRYDRTQSAFCILNNVGPGVDGVAMLMTGQNKGLKPGPMFNHNDGNVYLIPRVHPPFGIGCGLRPYTTPFTGGPRGDGVVAPADGFWYAIQIDGVTRFEIDPPAGQGPVEELLAHVQFVEPGASTDANLVTFLLTLKEEGIVSGGLAGSMMQRLHLSMLAEDDGNREAAATIVQTLLNSVQGGIRQNAISDPDVADRLIELLETKLGELGA